MPLRSTLPAVLIASVLLVAACSDDDGDGDSGEATALTKAEFIEQANAICVAGEQEGEAALVEAFGDATEQPSAEEVADVAVPVLERQIDEIDALGAPQGDEQEVDEFLDAAREGLAEVEGDPEGTLTGESNPFAEANELSEAYGLDECSS